jgi:hypothetical protein
MSFAAPHGRQQTRIGDAVSATVLYMSISLDGFIARPNEGPDNALAAGVLDELELHMHYRVQR